MGDINGSSWPYWSVDLPGLTERGAAAIVNFANAGALSGDGTSVDPHVWFTSHLPIDGARQLASILRRVAEGNNEAGPGDVLFVNGLADSIGDWIAEVESA